VFGDARQYHYAALAITEHRFPIQAEGPFVYRLATPWLTSVVNPVLKASTPRWLDALVDHWTALDDTLPWYLVNAIASLLFGVLLLRYLRHFIDSALVRLVLLTMWYAQWHAPVRFLYFNPVNVEPLFLLAIIVGLLVIEEQRTAPVWRAALILVPVAAVGALCRESMVLLPLAFAAGRQPLTIVARRDWKAALAVVLPLAAAIAALAFTRYVAEPTKLYDPLAEPLRMLRTKPIDSWFLAWFFTFGPGAIALMAAAAPAWWRVLRERRDMLVWGGGCCVLAFVGGSDTERILGWSVPVVYVLLGLSIVRWRDDLRRRPWLVAVLVMVQLVSARIFWPIPAGYDNPQSLQLSLSWTSLYELADRFFVIRHNYANLWSYFGSRIFHIANLLWDVALVGALVWLLRRQPARPPSVPASD
jgi:hypothetical protein